MSADIFVFKGVTIRKDQEDFIEQEKKAGEKFKLSKFLQFKLDEWIKFRKEGKEFMQEINNGEKKT